MKHNNILVGNTFPLALIKRKAVITPIPLDALKDSLKNAERICSYWGHSNTEKAAQNILGVKFAKEDFRKPLRLSGNNMPMWGDLEFNKCYILSPNYKNGFRPEINKEVEPSEILSWKALLIEWE